MGEPLLGDGLRFGTDCGPEKGEGRMKKRAEAVLGVPGRKGRRKNAE